MSSEDLSEAERRFLLGVARRAIEARLGGEPLPREEASGALQEPRGAFVTLRLGEGGELRGCVGYVEPGFPLVETVARAAVAAATQDGRFEPVTARELPSLTVEISALGPVRRVRPEEIEVGTHGLIMRCGGRGGLLLPQVATEHGWDRETFLDNVCRKAGLPPGTWRSVEAELLAFTATVFGEE